MMLSTLHSGRVHPDELRTSFALAMSHMYKNEVPLYGNLVHIVQSENNEILMSNSNTMPPDSRERLTLERHGAIRLGKAEELYTVRRIFALLGMQPVGYYDLSVAGLPVHATCFRSIDTKSLAVNPFRVFTTLLRPELIRSPAAHDLALQLLQRRNIFSQELLRMLDVAEAVGGQLRVEQAEIFICEALRTFSWAPLAEASQTEYQLLQAENPILADIASFRTAHINHLTPRALDIDAARAAMAAEGMPVKDLIEGPPRRKWPILLRQTSFLALEEKIQFKSRDTPPPFGEENAKKNVGNLVDGSHKARFGEIEERGAAVTPAGRALYDKLLESSMHEAGCQRTSPEAVDDTFRAYPDTWDELRKQELVYVKYSFTGKLPSSALLASELGKPVVSPSIIESLIEDGYLGTSPITYEDFLPFSAAGIFQSNLSRNSKPLQVGESQQAARQADMVGLEHALGCSVIDPDVLYARAQEESLESSLLNLKSLLIR